VSQVKPSSGVGHSIRSEFRITNEHTARSVFSSERLEAFCGQAGFEVTLIGRF